ncbi:MAG: hypothetical protein C0478_18625 [Planctomyces sp.]|nr:hypothetical protein [Planctomyces sp.]
MLPVIIEGVFDLLFGWVGYLATVLPRVSVRWDAVAMFVASLALATVVAHLTFSWFHREFQQRREQSVTRWRWKWTLVLMAGFLLLFAAGISFVGVTHQMSWLATSPEPLVGRGVLLARLNNPSRWHLKFLGTAFDNTLDTYTPEGYYAKLKGDPPQNWILPMLPFLSYRNDETDPELPWNEGRNRDMARRIVPELINHELRNAPVRDADGWGMAHYAGNTHVFDRESPLPKREDYHQSQAMLIGPVNTGFQPWMKPGNTRDPLAPWNTASGFGGPPGRQETTVLLMDGSVKTIPTSVDREVLRALATGGLPTDD